MGRGVGRVVAHLGLVFGRLHGGSRGRSDHRAGNRCSVELILTDRAGHGFHNVVPSGREALLGRY